MATIVNMHQAKSQLSKLVEKALAGEEVIVARAGKPAVRLTIAEPEKPVEKPGLRPMGLLRGKIWIAPDFDDPLPEDLLAEFYKDDLDFSGLALVPANQDASNDTATPVARPVDDK